MGLSITDILAHWNHTYPYRCSVNVQVLTFYY